MNYFIDSRTGSDINTGTSISSPWQNISKLNSLVLNRGDRILLASGSEWNGSIKPVVDKTTGSACSIEAYGSGPRPRINGCGCVPATIQLYNAGDFMIRGLEITNFGTDSEDAPARQRRIGIYLECEDAEIKDIVIEDNEIHDVNGSNVKCGENISGGIYWFAHKGIRDIPSRFNGIRIVNNRIARCDRIGISSSGMHRRDNWFPSLNIMIAGNLLEDIGGDAIVPIATDGCVIERNRVIGGRKRDTMYCAGIWPWSSDRTVIRFNEVCGYMGVMDGQGFDCDDNCISTLHEYNYSHDNEGGYMLVCTVPPTLMIPHDPSNIGCMGSVIQRNLSVNDLCRTFHIAGPVMGTVITENCVYVGRGIDIPVFQYTGKHEPMGPPADTVITRNLLIADGTMRYVEAVNRLKDGTFTFESIPNPAYIKYSGNHFVGNHIGKPVDSGNPITCPDLDVLKEIVLDKYGQARHGLQVMEEYVYLMSRNGWR